VDPCEAGSPPPEGPGTIWQRSLILVTRDPAVTEYDDLEFFSVRRTAIEGWEEDLGVDLVTDTRGLLLARFVDGDTGEPIEGGVLEYGGGNCLCQGAATSCGADACDGRVEYFADEEMTSFSEEAATGPGGALLAYGLGLTESCTATADGYSSTGFTCGASTNRLSAANIILLTAD
jgi:hypothetical protein